MDGYRRHKSVLLEINNDIAGLMAAAGDIPELSHPGLAEWEKTCRLVPQQLEEEIMRVAVVGTIKSGKSTFLNSLLRGDYLKRGAGVVTSIVTRVHNGTRLRATLYFKSWDEVNRDMEQSLVLFPSLNWRSSNGTFDIRNERERQELMAALENLAGEHFISQDARNINSVLLDSYLHGYEQVKDTLTDSGAIRMYEENEFGRHREFVGNEELAVYLRDVAIEINSADFDRSIEIADCQGSDSPNPLHLAMIQDYLLMTHLIVYVVSSRTGLRQADIRFLNIIKRMGILDNTLFVINSDFSEHESLADLRALVKKASSELALVQPQPTLFSFSALYNLFSQMPAELADKDKLRLAQWEADAEMVAFARQETGRFTESFQNAISRKRYRLLFQNHLERMGIILDTMAGAIGLTREILGKDSQGAQDVVDRIDQHQKRLAQIKKTIASAVAGAVTQVKQEMRAAADKYLDHHAGPVMQELQGFITAYAPAPDSAKRHLEHAGFAQALYHLFQQFKQVNDVHLTENINPAIVQFIRELETRIVDFLRSVVSPYESMIGDVYADYRSMLEELGVGLPEARLKKSTYPDIEAVVRVAGLRRPSLMTTLRYSARIRTDAVIRYSAYRMLRNVKKLLKKPLSEELAEAERALAKGLVRMKQEALDSIGFQLTDYRENLKFNYLFRLIDAAAASYTEIILARFQSHFADLDALTNSLSRTQGEKENARSQLSDMLSKTDALEERIAALRRDISGGE